MSKKGTPAPPDYSKLLAEQEQANFRDFNRQLAASRPSVSGPTGTASWTRTPGAVNRSAYESALADWNSRNEAASAITPGTAMPGGDGSEMPAPWARGPEAPGVPGPGLDPSTRPTEDQFRGEDSWALDMQLNPQEQAVYDADAQNRLGYQQSIAQLLPSLDMSPITGSSDERMQQISDAIFNKTMRYAQPRMDRQEAGLRDDLLSQGFNFTDETAIRPMERLREDQDQLVADLADRAVLAGAQEDSRQFSQNLSARNAPFSWISSLRSGGQPNLNLPTATYSTPGLQGTDRVGAANQGYAAQVEATNAQNAAIANMVSAFMRAAGGVI